MAKSENEAKAEALNEFLLVVFQYFILFCVVVFLLTVIIWRCTCGRNPWVIGKPVKETEKAAAAEITLRLSNINAYSCDSKGQCRKQDYDGQYGQLVIIADPPEILLGENEI